jgi:hypothetical protein
MEHNSNIETTITSPLTAKALGEELVKMGNLPLEVVVEGFGGSDGSADCEQRGIQLTLTNHVSRIHKDRAILYISPADKQVSHG